MTKARKHYPIGYESERGWRCPHCGQENSYQQVISERGTYQRDLILRCKKCAKLFEVTN